MQKQIHIKLAEKLHKDVRLRAAEVGQTLQEYVVNTLKLSVLEQPALFSERNLKPAQNDQSKFTFVDLFAGIGGTRIAFERAGGWCIFSSEWDSHCKKTYFDNFGDIPEGDITRINENDIPDHDILVAGFPCQPFSIAGVSKKKSLGRKHGFLCETQGTLFFDVARILQAKRPKMFMLENVKNLFRHDSGKTFKTIENTLEKLEYNITCDIVDACNHVPQHRERLFIVGLKKDFYGENSHFIFPEQKEQANRVKDILEKKVDPKYTLSNKLWQYLQDYAEKHKARGNGFGFGLVSMNGIARTLSARYYKDGSEILIPQRNKNPRRLTPRECARLMGFPEDFKITVSDTQAYRQFGNSVVVPVVESIARAMVPCLEQVGKASVDKPA